MTDADRPGPDTQARIVEPPPPGAPWARERWTAVIPAAGRGTRLGHDAPKILFPVGGRPILERLVDAVGPVCERLVLVLSPEGAGPVDAALPGALRERVDVVVQPEPVGMADAVRRGCSAVRTPFVVVLWGDQVMVRRQTVEAGVRLHESRGGVSLTLPTVEVPQPYVAFLRDERDRIVGIAQAREGEAVPAPGESDCGLFFFSTDALADELGRAAGSGLLRGRVTGEENLLQLIPRLDGAGGVISFRVPDPREALGVNDADDADRAAAILAARGEGT